MNTLDEAVDEKSPKDNYGNTPMHFAAEKGHLEITKTIIYHLRDPNLETNRWGLTPLL